MNKRKKYTLILSYIMVTGIFILSLYLPNAFGLESKPSIDEEVLQIPKWLRMIMPFVVYGIGLVFISMFIKAVNIAKNDISRLQVSSTVAFLFLIGNMILVFFVGNTFFFFFQIGSIVTMLNSIILCRRVISNPEIHLPNLGDTSHK